MASLLGNSRRNYFPTFLVVSISRPHNKLYVTIVKDIMRTLLSKDYVLEPVTVNDLQLASLAWGFTIGFGFLTTWTAMKQTAHMQRRYTLSKLNSPYIWMIWLEILVCVIFSVICWLHLNNIIPPRYVYTFSTY